MPEVTLEMNSGGPSEHRDTHTEDGFAITTGQPFSLPPYVAGGLRLGTDGGAGYGEYFLPTYSNATVFVETVAPGKTFGFLSIDVDGFVNNDTGVGGIRSLSAPVTFTFVGINPNLLMPIVYEFTTDAAQGFEHIVLPEAFASGLIQLSWTATDGTNVWGAFDNLVLRTNSGPSATGAQGTTTVGADGTITGQLGGQDPDDDALTYQLVNPVAGVSIGTDGAFFVERQPQDDDLLPGQTRTVSFEYTVNDGSETSAAQTVSVTFAAPPKGSDVYGTKRSETLNGTGKSESLYGKDGHDKLNGLGGADKLYGDDGRDTLSGGAGHDQLWGGDDEDRIDGGAGNDTLSGGDDNDQFYFDVGFGADVVLDFRSGRWEKDDHHHHHHHSHGHWEWDAGDVIKFNPSVFGSFSDVMANAVQTWYGTVITAPDGSTLTLVGVLKWSLDSEDFLFG